MCLVIVGNHDGRRHGLTYQIALVVGDGEDDVEALLLGMMAAVTGDSHLAINRETTAVIIWSGPVPDLLAVEDDYSPTFILQPELVILRLLQLLPASSLPFAGNASLANVNLSAMLALVDVVLALGHFG
jgi:hypothetical protein